MKTDFMIRDRRR